MLLRVADDNLAAFVAFLGLGLMYAMHEGAVSYDAGLTIRPDFWEPLQGKIPQPIWDVIYQADELHGLPKDIGTEESGELIKILLEELRKIARDDLIGYMSWVQHDADCSWD